MSKYQAKYAREAKKLCLGGARDDELAEHFGVCRKTIQNWRIRFPKFAEACRLGKDAVDDEIERSLYQKARDGDTTAIIFWLKNRRPHLWRDKRHVEVRRIDDMSEDELIEYLGGEPTDEELRQVASFKTVGNA